MAAIDRGVRRALAHLDSDEGLLACVVGHEPGGRRRRVLVATDRQVLLVPLRPEPVVRIPRTKVQAVELVEESGGTRLTLTTDDRELVLDHIADRGRARLLVPLLRSPGPLPRPAPDRVRIIAS